MNERGVFDFRAVSEFFDFSSGQTSQFFLQSGPRRAAPATNRYAAPNAQVAQLVEQGTENPRVGGSIPSLGTILFPNEINGLAMVFRFHGWRRFTLFQAWFYSLAFPVHS